MQTKICTAKHSNIHATQGSQTAKLLLISSGMYNFAAESKNRFFLAKPFQIFTNSS